VSYLFKDLKGNVIINGSGPAATREELFDRSSLATTPRPDLTKPLGDRWLIVRVRLENGKWVETPDESEPDRIWRLICESSTT
jgi:hypothetical protein